MNTTLSHLDALLERRTLSGSDRLASLNKSIEAIERKLGNLGNPALNQDDSGSKFAELERRVREMTGGLASKSDNSPQPKPTSWSAGLGRSNPLAEIAERKRVLNDATNIHPIGQASRGVQEPGSNGHNPLINGPVGQSVSGEIQELSKQIDALRTELASELNGINRSVSLHSDKSSSTDELDRIAQGIRELQQAPRFDPTAFDALHRELDELRLSLGASVRHEDFNSGINDLTMRLDQLSSNLNPIDPAEFAEIKHRLDLINSNTATDNTAVLMSRIDALSQLVDKQSNAEMVEKLDQRLQALVNSVETLASRKEPQPDSGDEFKAIEARLDEITRAIVAVSVNETKQPSADSDAIIRLEGQLAALAQGVETVVRKNDDEQFAQLANRIESLSGNLETMGARIQNVATVPDPAVSSEIENQLKELARKLDTGAAQKRQGEDQLSELASRIDGLTENFGSFAIAAANGDNANPVPVTVVPDTSQIENQLQQLANRLDNAISGSSTDNQLQNLETQIADIASKLGAAGNANIDLGEVNSRLGAIEQNIGASRDFTLEAASKAAQSAVEMMGDQGFSGELINALAEDLRALHTAASQTESRTIDSIDNVQATLNGMVGRLGSIENLLKQQPLEPKTPAAKPANGKAAKPAVGKASIAASRFVGASSVPGESDTTKSDMPANIDAMSVQVAPSPRAKVSKAPSIDPTTDLRPDGAVNTEDNRPLEPGILAPDIPALIKRATDNLSGNSSGSQFTGEKTDFVAAARRAAQAAVSEVKSVKADITDTPELETSPQETRKIPRKPIIIAAAAVLMAVIAFAGSRVLFGNSGDTAVVAVNQPMKTTAEGTEVASLHATPHPASAPVPNVRTAVPNSAPEKATTAPSAKASNGDGSSTNDKVAFESTSGFTAGSMPKVSDKFTARTNSDTEMAMATGADTAGAAKTKLSSGSIYKMGTAAQMPPAGLGPIELRQAAAKGDVRAQHEVALRYTNGTDVKRNFAEAAKWYERAAAGEFAPAQYRLGSLYEKGLGVKRDLGTAMNWYARAAEQGNARAMHNLAVISAMGTKGDPNMDKALSWFTRAANYGVKDSQFNLGILHGQGMGVKQDLAESYKWFALAAKTGDTDAAKKRDEVANVMDPKALEKARLVVQNWRPQKLLASANQVVIPEQWRGKAKVQNASLSVKETIKQTQMLLNKLGYKVGAPDGKLGPKTRRAIVSFQQKSGLSPTGTINAELVKALKGMNI